MTKTAKFSNFRGYDFLDLYRRESNARGKIRLLSLYHLEQGKSILAVSRILCVTPKTIYSWISWYNDQGLGRIISKPIGRGRKKKISVDTKDLQLGIASLQEERDGGRVIGDDIIEWIASNYGTRYSKGHIYNFLKSIGLSWVSVRSKHPKADAGAQDKFKKNLQ